MNQTINLTFDIFFPGPPEYFLVFLGVLLVLVLYWIYQFLKSMLPVGG